MKYPSSPEVGLVGGKFSDGDPLNGVPASLDPAEHMNAITDELLAVITACGLVPSESDVTQLLKAIQSEKLTGGRLLGIQVFTASGIYTPTVGTRKVRVRAQGAGAGRGGLPATTAGQCSIASAGGAGSYGEGWYTAGFSGVAVTVGGAGIAGGAGATSGGVGGTSSFGALLSCPGGQPSALASAISVFPVSGGYGQASGDPAGANIIGAAGCGSPQYLCVNSTTANGFTEPTASPIFGVSFGSGAVGGFNPPSAAAQTGGVGRQGVVIIEGYA
ncbi:hypothetical protein [uncultured Deefgea sp.]|uniref:hypothetical protein n=1 Tax=uncultured Deefgea sp. TaxID=1304914 RepID=UPI0025948502|nr:hypothetical protein [uncultured Deefgea sp.]